MLEAEERPVADRLDEITHPAQSTRLFGHDDAFGRVEKAWQSGRLHHAWLISGPRGIGKATLAFHLAKGLLSHPKGAADGVTLRDVTESSAAQVANGAHPNLLHLTRPWDDKGKRFKTQLSVDEIRRTRNFYGMTAGGDGWRVAIVDAADDMNASAANALLKILEEPPKQSIFFVITHSAGSLLPTIRSRCQMLRLGPLPDNAVISTLDHLGVQSGDDTRARIGTLSGGSPRRAIQLLHGKVLSHYSTFETLMGQGAVGAASEWAKAHSIAEALSRRDAEQDFTLFIDLALAWIGGTAQRNAATESLQLLATWGDVWEKATRMVTVSDAFNLDRKQVILNLFALVFERNAAVR
ncbi:DNA polymerase III subunit delta' [Pseudahrensia aquimaris]|uniref:DNA polymerase III subunit delta n=1 Tax=Pseudahrensia aquimaris TaxID=744461 RepID=A0ABW3FIP0_9HYPH